MPLTLDEETAFQDVVSDIDANRRLLSKWEENFFYGDDPEWPGVIKAFFERGGDVVITPKMWVIIRRVHWKVTH